jgi:hypothetical protein
LASKCAARGGTCCRDLKGDDERTLIDPDIVRDVVIGLSGELSTGVNKVGKDSGC